MIGPFSELVHALNYSNGRAKQISMFRGKKSPHSKFEAHNKNPENAQQIYPHGKSNNLVHALCKNCKSVSSANVYSGFGSISNAFYLYTVRARACSSTPYRAHAHPSRRCGYRVRLSTPYNWSKTFIT